jgi:hypothetical protein
MSNDKPEMPRTAYLREDHCCDIPFVGAVTYISLQEAEAMVREARAKAFEDAIKIEMMQDEVSPAIILFRKEAAKAREGKDE